jgi:hypothetical protein
MNDGDYTNTYWGDNGRFQKEYDEVSKLIPAVGEVEDGKGKNKCLERLRRVCNAYYDVYNNGCGNRNADIRYFLKVRIREASAYNIRQETIDTMEERIDKYIMDAYNEQIALALGNINKVGQLELAI